MDYDSDNSSASASASAQSDISVDGDCDDDSTRLDVRSRNAMSSEDSSSQEFPTTSIGSTFKQPTWMMNPQNSSSSVKSRTDSIRDIIREASIQPELYGVRRSGRPRTSVLPSMPYGNYDGYRSPSATTSRNKNYASEFDESGDPSASDSGSDYGGHHKRKTKPKAKRRTSTTAGKRRRPNVKAEKRKAVQPTTFASSNLSSGDNDSDADFAGRSSSDGSEDDYYRGSKWQNKRATQQAVSYKEQSSDESTDMEDVVDASEQADDAQSQEEDNAETIEKVLRHRIGRKGAIGSQTVSYVAENEGDPNDGFDPSIDESEVHYFIKWKGWAHIHNTWDSEASLREQKVNGLKRLDNYIKKEECLSSWKKRANIDELEYFACQQEMTEQLQNQYCQVERVIRCKTQRNEVGDLVTDYLVKWQGLPYSCCTEEDGNLIDRLFPKAVDEYHCRLKSACTPTPVKLCRALKIRPKFVPLKDQPSHLGGEDCMKLRDYQLEGVNWLVHSWCKENSVILADEMGLGKTIQTISFLSVLMNSYAVYGPFLLLVPLSTLATWIKEFRIWAPHINVVEYIGDVNSRAIIREEEWCHPGNKKIKFNVLITTYEILMKDKDFLDKLDWAVLGVDEAHRLKNDDSTLYKYLITFKTNHRLLITGTPLQNSLQELWALLHFLMPEKYSRWEDFEAKHVSADKTGFLNLHAELQPFLLRRVKKDVEKSLPAKVEQILRVEMSNVQKKYYKWILTKNYRELSKGAKNSTAGFLNIAMELKKCCNHAFLVRPPEESEVQHKSRFELLVKSSGKLILLDKLLMRLKEAGHRVLIFSQMVRMLDILAEYLQLRRFCFQRLDGSIRGELRKQAMEHFNAEYSQDFCFLLSTRAGGLGVNLATADTVIIFDSDWNPQNDLQAQARAHRIGQKNQVSVYRLVTKNSMEEDILERAKKKMVLDHLVIQRMDTTGRTAINPGSLSGQSTNNTFNREELNAILKFGAEELFKETDDDDELQVDIDDILRVAEQRTVEDSKNSATDELLSQFKVVSFENLEDEELEGHSSKGPTWDAIIPEAERRRIEDEELHKQLVALHPPPRSRKSVNSSNTNGRQSSGQIKKASRDSSEDDVDRDNDDESGSDKPRKRGRPRTVQDIKGFTNTEVRRFLKSIKKFGRPVDRLDDIACDAELQEKSKSDLIRLANLIQERCQETMEAYEVHCEDESNTTRQPPTFKLSKVTVNAKLTLQAINDLEPLIVWMNDSTLDHASLPPRMHVKDAHFDCSWTESDDASMLRGIYKYGTGNWEAVRIDPALNLSQILPDRNLKPQAKHLQTRFEYLLRALRNHAAKSVKLCKPVDKPKVPRSRAKVKDPPAEAAIPPVLSNGHATETNLVNTTTDGDDTSCDVKFDVSTDCKKPKVKNEKKKRSVNGPPKKVPDNLEKVKSQPLHITTNETKTVAESVVELLPEVFAQCKEKMRPVKKALKQLGSPDPNSPQEAHLEHTRRCLLKIGDHINDLLNSVTDPTALKEWRNNLWLFVSKFTDLTPNRLHKVYRHMAKKRDEEDGTTDGCQTSNVSVDEADGHHDSSQKHASSNSSFSLSENLKSSAVSNRRNNETTSVEGVPSRLANSERGWRHNSPLARDELSRHRNDDNVAGFGRPHGYSQGNDRNQQRYGDNKYSDRHGGGSQASRADKTQSDSQFTHDSSSRHGHSLNSSSNCNASRSDDSLSNRKRSFNSSQNSVAKSGGSSRMPELKKCRVSAYDDPLQNCSGPMSRNR